MYHSRRGLQGEIATHQADESHLRDSRASRRSHVRSGRKFGASRRSSLDAPCRATNRANNASAASRPPHYIRERDCWVYIPDPRLDVSDNSSRSTCIVRHTLTMIRYQETCFARRQLIFTGGQVVFLCKYASNWAEDRVVEDRAFVLNEFEDGGTSSWDGDDDIRSYEAPVQNYSDRMLSFPSDVYNAFAGVAQRIRDLLGVDLCHGIPPPYFDWCLLWDPLNRLTRRQGTPSWSWSGWEGGAFPHIWDWYSPKTRRIQKALKVRTWIIWYQRVAHDSTECRLVWNATLKKGVAHGSRNFYGGQVQSRFSMNCSQTQPTKRKLTGAPTYYPDILSDAPGSGFLQFWTLSVEFQLKRSESEAAHTPRRGHTQLGIFGSSGWELGTIQVTDVWLEKSQGLPSTGEFILLCEARDERADGGNYDAEPGWRYKIMLLEWHGEYAERVAVGSINKGDELEGSPTWKEIILG